MVVIVLTSYIWLSCSYYTTKKSAALISYLVHTKNQLVSAFVTQNILRFEVLGFEAGAQVPLFISHNDEATATQTDPSVVLPPWERYESRDICYHRPLYAT